VTAPGWYKDPVDQDVQRYWDGEGWIGEPVPASQPAPSQPPAVPPPPPPAPKPAPASTPTAEPAPAPASVPPAPPVSAPPVVTTPGVPLPQGAVVLPPGTPIPPGGFPPGQLPPGAIVLPPGTPLPPGLRPQGTVPSGAVQVLLPPQSLPSRDSVRPHGYALASLGSRLLARLVDILVVAVLAGAVTGWFIYQYVRDVGPTLVTMYRQQLAGQPMPDATTSERSAWLQVVILVLIAALWFAYEVPSIAGSGQTLGKRLLKIKVVGLKEDQPIGFRRAIRRWNPLGIWVLLWSCCGIGFVMQFIVGMTPIFDWPLHRGIYDRSADTVVVRAERPTTPLPSTETPNAGDQP